MIMIEYMHRLCNSIRKARFHGDVDLIKRLKPGVEQLEGEEEFRDYIRETLKDKDFHDNFFYRAKNFPFPIISYLSYVGVPPGKNFLIQEIITIINMENRAFIEYLIKEYLLHYFPQNFKDKVLSDKEYRKLYNLIHGY